MSSNPFAALDDSGDEAPPKKAPASKKKATVAPSSKPDPKSKPKNNDRNTKHGRGGRPPARDGKRTYDRRSGTGRGKEIKKGGGGARNWGSDKNEAKKAEGRINEDEDIAPPAVDAEGAEAPAVEEPKVEDNSMTYAEYMASKGKKEEVAMRDVKNEFEGVTESEKREEESFMAMGTGKKKKEKKQKEAKKTVDVGFRVAKANSGGEGRGDRRDGRGRGRGDRRDGRGRGRGGRGSGRGSDRGSGRGGPRGPKKPQGLNVQDEGAFPSL